jgi:hypothetical protein
MDKKFFKLSEAIQHFKSGQSVFFSPNRLAIDRKKPGQIEVPITSLDELAVLSTFVIEIENKNGSVLPVILKYLMVEDELMFFEIKNIAYNHPIRNIVTRLTTIQSLVDANNLNEQVRMVKYASDIEEKVAYLQKSKMESMVKVDEQLLERIPIDRLFYEIEHGKTCYLKLNHFDYVQSWLAVRMFTFENTNYFLYSKEEDELYLVTVEFFKKNQVTWFMERE